MSLTFNFLKEKMITLTLELQFQFLVIKVHSLLVLLNMIGVLGVQMVVALGPINGLVQYHFPLIEEQFWKIKTSDLSHRVIPSNKKMDFARTLKHLLIKKYLMISKREPGKLSLLKSML